MTGSSATLYFDFLHLEMGYWLIEANESAIKAIWYSVDKPEREIIANEITAKSLKQLSEYIDGERKTFDLPLDMERYSPFYQSVWQCLLEIPYGKTCTYSDIAHKLNNPKSVRAVGMANGKNPFSIVVPCHRVIGKNGKLTGYAQGLDVKEWLLMHEGALKKPLTLF